MPRLWKSCSLAITASLCLAVIPGCRSKLEVKVRDGSIQETGLPGGVIVPIPSQTTETAVSQRAALPQQMRALYLTTSSEVPPCTTDNIALLVYVAADKQFLTCQQGDWQIVQIESGTVWSEGNNANSAMITTEVLAAGAECPAGGMKVLIGEDRGTGDVPVADGLLTGDEIKITQFLCNGRDGLQGPAGERGPKGEIGPQGLQGLAGATGERGPQGVAGAQGLSGFNALADISNTAPDAACPYGGKKVVVGVDDGSNGGTASNGILEIGERRNE